MRHNQDQTERTYELHLVTPELYQNSTEAASLSHDLYPSSC